MGTDPSVPRSTTRPPRRTSRGTERSVAILRPQHRSRLLHSTPRRMTPPQPTKLFWTVSDGTQTKTPAHVTPAANHQKTRLARPSPLHPGPRRLLQLLRWSPGLRQLRSHLQGPPSHRRNASQRRPYFHRRILARRHLHRSLSPRHHSVLPVQLRDPGQRPAPRRIPLDQRRPSLPQRLPGLSPRRPHLRRVSPRLIPRSPLGPPPSSHRIRNQHSRTCRPLIRLRRPRRSPLLLKVHLCPWPSKIRLAGWTCSRPNHRTLLERERRSSSRPVAPSTTSRCAPARIGEPEPQPTPR